LQTVVVLGVDYWHPRPPKPSEGLLGKVSCYAWGRDYHKIINNKLKKLARKLKDMDESLEGYWTVDSRPVIERGWAEKSGLGFVGKNTMIISPANSSYFFLATLLINVAVESDAPIAHNHCGRCTRCLDMCPTEAFVDAFRLDARKCISYLTIEHKGVIERSLAEKMQDWLFGCDVCQDVCPHNHRKLLSDNPDLAPKPQMAWMDLEWLCKSKENDVLDRLAGMPLRRTGVERLRRNAVVTLHNSKQSEAATLLKWLRIYAKESLVQDQLSELGYP
jgi:epoxyqueuosine reductase